MDTSSAQFQTIIEAARNARQGGDPIQVLDNLLHQLLKAFEAEAGFVLLALPRGGLEMVVQAGLADWQCDRILQTWQDVSSGPLADPSPAGGDCVLVESLASEIRYEGLWEEPEKRQALGFPVWGPEGLIGGMWLVSPAGRRLHDWDSGNLEVVGCLIAMRMESLHMRTFLRRQQQELQRQAAQVADVDRRKAGKSVQFRRLEALLTIVETIGKASSLERMLQDALDAVLEVTGMDSGGARIYDEANACFHLVGHSGMSREMRQELMCIPADRGFPAAAARKEAPVYTSDISKDPRTTGAQYSTILGYKSLVSVPLIAEGRVLGTMELSTKATHAWTRDEIRWLATIGRLVGLSIQQMRHSELALGLAMLQERGRLGREIHDGLAQLLGTLPMWVEEARAAFAADEEGQILTALAKIERGANDAYASLREEILELRSETLKGSGLTEILRDYLRRFNRQWNLATELILEDEQWNLSPAAEMQLLRVIQEAMTNVRRHADARRIEIAFQTQGNSLYVRVRDDGRGFDPQAVSEGHHGLRIMQERVRGVGGQLKVDSTPGQGTCIQIEMPLTTLHPARERG